MPWANVGGLAQNDVVFRLSQGGLFMFVQYTFIVGQN